MDIIIGQFLDFAKPLDSLLSNQVNLSKLLRKVVEETAKYPEMIVRSAITPDLFIPGSSVELYRLFTNLIENSRRYGHCKGTSYIKMDIQCSEQSKGRKSGILISFRDYGVGVPEAELSKLLKPFTRVDASRSQANGSGLGLAIVDKTVKHHGGRIRIKTMRLVVF